MSKAEQARREEQLKQRRKQAAEARKNKGKFDTEKRAHRAENFKKRQEKQGPALSDKEPKTTDPKRQAKVKKLNSVGSGNKTKSNSPKTPIPKNVKKSAIDIGIELASKLLKRPLKEAGVGFKEKTKAKTR